MNTEAERVCRVCGMILPTARAACPVCMFRGALNPEGINCGSASDPDASQRELRFEHYRVLRNEDGTPIELGRGAMGVTYKALDTNLRCAVALKVINARLIGDESARRRFVREARAAASVRHPNVASVFHLGKTRDGYFFAMEFVEGESLDKTIRRFGRLEPSVALNITTLIAAGLEAIHKQNLVHRDIKPNNIMVSLQGDEICNAKIIDLGLVKGEAIEDDSISAQSTQGIFVGTPAFASPEQFNGLRVDIRSDLYSLGVTLWGMLFGEVPFRGSFSELYHQHQDSSLPIQKLTQIPHPVGTLLEILLEKDPSRRFQTPTEFRQAISKVIEALSSGQRVTADRLRLGANAIAAKPESRRWFRLALAGVSMRFCGWLLALALCVAGLLLLGFVFPGYTGFLFNLRMVEGVPSAQSVAILPFESLSESKSDAYFADGVQDEILNNLSKIAQLKVVSRTSVMQYRGDNKRDLRQIASALGVTNVLEGTVRRDGNHVRVSTDLVDARNDNTIWADSYDRDLTDIFAIQSEIAQKVASRLSAKLSPEERKDIEEKPTNSLEAYDLYLQGKQLLNNIVIYSGEKETHLKAIGLLEQATQKDNKFALAYCLIAKAHDYLYAEQFDPTPQRRALGDAAVNEALRLRPDLPEVHLAMAFHLYTCYRDYERAQVQIAIAARALSNDPNLLELKALIDQAEGRWDNAAAGLEKAAALDPRNPALLDSLAQNYWWRRRYRDNERILDRLIQLRPDQPSFGLEKSRCAFAEKADVKNARAAYEEVPPAIRDDSTVTLYRLYFALCARDFYAAEDIISKSPDDKFLFFGAWVPRRIATLWVELVRGNHPTVEEFGAAREQLSQKVEADPTNPFLMNALALADVALGRREESLQEARRAMEMRPTSEDAVYGPTIAANVMLVYVWADQFDAAFEGLRVLVRLPNYRLNYGDLKTYPGWDPIRKDPRFDELLAELAP
jgi:TolB-like protein/Flp pilus assembly protein TadD